VKMFDAGKTIMIGLPYGEKNYDDMLSRFHMVPKRNGRTDGRTDRFAISISRVSMLTHDKNNSHVPHSKEYAYARTSENKCGASINFTGEVKFSL